MPLLSSLEASGQWRWLVRRAGLLDLDQDIVKIKMQPLVTEQFYDTSPWQGGRIVRGDADAEENFRSS